MKQHITREQWYELSGEQMVKTGLSDIQYPWYNMCIGGMIEFLGDDISFIEWGCSPRDIKIVTTQKFLGYVDGLCDTLWEAVKYKLK